MSAIHTVLHREAATWAGQRRRRPEALQRRWLLIPEPMRGAGPAGVGLSAAARADPTAEREAKSHLHFPFPAQRAQFRDHPRTPHHKERFFSIWVRSKFIGLSQLSGTPGFVVHPSRPPRQGRDPEESPNYNPHSAPRASPIPAALSPSPCGGQRPRTCSGRQGAAVNLGTPPAALPLAQVSLGLITRVPQAGRPLVMRSRWGWGGAQAAATAPSPLVHDVRVEAVAWRTVAMAARAVRWGRCGASELAPGRSLKISPACRGREARGFHGEREMVTLRRSADQVSSGAA